MSGSCFFRGDDRNIAANKGATPVVTRRLADGEIVVVVTASQIAAANPSMRHDVEIVVVDPSLVMRDTQNPVCGRQQFVGNPRQQLHGSSGSDGQALVVLNECQRYVRTKQLDFGDLAESCAAGAKSFESDGAALPIQERGIDTALVACIANLILAI